MRNIDLTNKRFGRLTALNVVGKTKRGGNIWLCKCDCGGFSKTVSFNLRDKHTRSCGCLQREISVKVNKVHGKLNTAGYHTWVGIKRRCYNKRNKGYKWYGGRGIRVCERWLKSFSNFIKDMGAPPAKDMCLDRIDNDGDYTPSNCQWLTRSQNNSKMNRERKEKKLASLEEDKLQGDEEKESVR